MRSRHLIWLLGLAAACACARVEASRPTVQVDMQNVDLHVAPGITLHVRHMQGQFVPVSGNGPYLDEARSYTVLVESGEVALDVASLNALVNRTLGGGRSNVRNLQLSIEPDGTLRQKGVLDKAINIPFNAKSTVSTTADGRMLIRTQSVKGFGVPVKPLMKLFSVEMDDLLKIRSAPGAVVAENDLVLDPSQLLSSPAVRGRLTGVRIERNYLVQTFGTGDSRQLASRPLAPNHIYWRGGQLSFGKLTMTGTDLELVDLDPSDPFDFSINDWQAQLVAGYSKTLPNGGLRAHVPDDDEVRQRRQR